MTEQEKEIIDLTVKLWNAYTKLPVIHAADGEETCRDIHNIQNRVLARAAWRELESGGKKV